MVRDRPLYSRDITPIPPITTAQMFPFLAIITSSNFMSFFYAAGLLLIRFSRPGLASPEAINGPSPIAKKKLAANDQMKAIIAFSHFVIYGFTCNCCRSLGVILCMAISKFVGALSVRYHRFWYCHANNNTQVSAAITESAFRWFPSVESRRM